MDNIGSSRLVYNMLLALVALVVVSIFKIQGWVTVIQETFIHCKGVGVEIWAKARTCNLFASLVVEHTQNHNQQTNLSSFALNQMPGPVPYCLWRNQPRLPISCNWMPDPVTYKHYLSGIFHPSFKMKHCLFPHS